jgi:predicted metal-dependent HD superfamily phosphohydrolase
LRRLLEAYAEPRRRYHTAQHLCECIALLGRHTALADEPAEIAIALWFHDAVYEPRATDNEARSAEWARETLGEAQVDRQRIERIEAHILATRHDAVAQGKDGALLVDIDLSILGAPRERFDEYESQVRAEYGWVPDFVFRRKRREFLKELLERPRLYQTPALHDELEARARDNLRHSLNR